MTTYFLKSCSFGLPRVPFVNCRQFMYLVISLLVLRAGCGIWLYQFLIIAYLFTSCYDRENEILLCWHTYVNAFGRRQYLPDVMDYLPVRSITVCWKNNNNNTLSHQCGPPLIGQTMTRHHRLAYVQWVRRHFILQCVDWNRVSFSGETRFALSNAGGKTHKQSLLGLLRAGKRSIWWGQFRGLGWKMGDQKTYFVVMQDNFNALYRRHLVTSCQTISPLLLHIKNWSNIWN